MASPLHLEYNSCDQSVSFARKKCPKNVHIEAFNNQVCLREMQYHIIMADKQLTVDTIQSHYKCKKFTLTHSTFSPVEYPYCLLHHLLQLSIWYLKQVVQFQKESMQCRSCLYLKSPLLKFSLISNAFNSLLLANILSTI